jgi:hypothetical protein
MRQDITGSTTDGTVPGVRAMAALGSLWHPVRALTAAQLSAHRDALIHATMAGWARRSTPGATHRTPRPDRSGRPADALRGGPTSLPARGRLAVSAG